MTLWNVRKKQILELVEKHGSVTSEVISRELDIPLQHASVRLLTYTRQGLLKREIASPNGNPFKKGRPSYAYALTKRGKERLEYFRKLEAEKVEVGGGDKRGIE